MTGCVWPIACPSCQHHTSNPASAPPFQLNHPHQHQRHATAQKMATSFMQQMQQRRAAAARPSSKTTTSTAAFTSVRPSARRSVVVRAEGAAAAPAPAAAGIEKSMTALKPVLDIEAIKGVLPHRYSFVWGVGAVTGSDQI